MLWAISRVNKPGSTQAREALLQTHRDYLHSQGHILVLSGALQTDDGAQGVGSLLVVNVGSRAEAQAFIDGDPMTQAGLFSSITITRLRKGHWNPAAMEGA